MFKLTKLIKPTKSNYDKSLSLARKCLVLSLFLFILGTTAVMVGDKLTEVGLYVVIALGGVLCGFTQAAMAHLFRHVLEQQEKKAKAELSSGTAA